MFTRTRLIVTCILTMSVLLNCCYHAVCGMCMYPPHQQLIILEFEKRCGSLHSIIEIWRCLILLEDDVSTFLQLRTRTMI